MLHSFALSLFGISMFSLVAVSVDRCWAVRFPVTYHVKGTATTKFIIVFCWVLGIFFGSLPTLGWDRSQFDNNCDYRVVTDLSSLMILYAVVAFMSTLTIVILYFLVYYEIHKQVGKNIYSSIKSINVASIIGKKAAGNYCKLSLFN